MRSIFAATVLGLALSLGVSACAVDAGSSSSTDAVASTAETLSALGNKVVGQYTRTIAKGNWEEFETLSLSADGTYAATKPSPTKGDPIPEAGSFRTASGDLILSPSRASSKRYTLSITSSGITITRAGTTHAEQLDKVVAPVTCATSGDCASGQECRFVSICPPAPPGGVTCYAGKNECVTVAQLGDSCGFRTPTTPCASGLDCRHVSGPLDALTCAVHIAAYDEPCGGFFATAAICGDGLECTHTDSDGKLFGNPDSPGRCRVAEGSACGGLTADPHACVYPLHSQLGTVADKGGVCQP